MVFTRIILEEFFQTPITLSKQETQEVIVSLQLILKESYESLF